MFRHKPENKILQKINIIFQILWKLIAEEFLQNVFIDIVQREMCKYYRRKSKVSNI